MDPIALYYPYIHVRDDRWLKYAALYWPRMGRLRPAGYPTSDSPVAQALKKDMNWLLDISPEHAAPAVEQPFLELLDEHSDALQQRFGVDRADRWPMAPRDGAPQSHGSWGFEGRLHHIESANPHLGYVQIRKISQQVVDSFVDTGLAVTAYGNGGSWLGMHPQLASVYTCAVIEQVATENHLHPITDQVLPHAALAGWTMQHLAEVLLESPLSGALRQRPGDPLDMFVLLAFETVVPADLDTVPVEKIIEIRAKFGPELDAFRTYVTEQVNKMAEITDVRDVTVFREYISTEVNRTVVGQLKELREHLRSVGLESVRALANVKSVALPPLAAAAAQTVGLSPAITGPTALAAVVAGVPAKLRQDRKNAIKESPVGYLFRIEQSLNPASLAERIRRSLTRQ